MIRNDYTKEIGVPSPRTNVPWPYTLAILAALAAAVIWFAKVSLHETHRPASPADHTSLVNQRPAHPPATSHATPGADPGRLTPGVT